MPYIGGSLQGFVSAVREVTDAFAFEMADTGADFLLDQARVYTPLGPGRDGGHVRSAWEKVDVDRTRSKGFVAYVGGARNRHYRASWRVGHRPARDPARARGGDHDARGSARRCAAPRHPRASHGQPGGAGPRSARRGAASPGPGGVGAGGRGEREAQTRDKLGQLRGESPPNEHRAHSHR